MSMELGPVPASCVVAQVDSCHKAGGLMQREAQCKDTVCLLLRVS